MRTFVEIFSKKLKIFQGLLRLIFIAARGFISSEFRAHLCRPKRRRPKKSALRRDLARAAPGIAKNRTETCPCPAFCPATRKCFSGINVLGTPGYCGFLWTIFMTGLSAERRGGKPGAGKARPSAAFLSVELADELRVVAYGVDFLAVLFPVEAVQLEYQPPLVAYRFYRPEAFVHVARQS